MREQLSFDHARPKELNITWWPMTTIKEHGNRECVQKGTANATGLATSAYSLASSPLSFAPATTEFANVSSSNTRVRRAGRGGAGGADGRAIRLIAGAKGAPLLLPPLSEVPQQALPLAQPLTQPPTLPFTLPQLTSSAGAQPLHVSRPELRHAVCVTGLRRSFPEISANLRSRVFGFLQSTAPNVEIRTFGVQPHNDSWGVVIEKLGPFEAVEKQASCRTKGQKLPAFFTCTRGRVVHRMDSCTASFVQMQCDLVHCDTMIQTYEVSEV